MADPMQVNVQYETRTYRTAIEPEERADQLLLRSLYHFDIEATAKSRGTGWHLKPRGAGRGERAIELDAPIGQQVSEGADLVLEEDTPEAREPSTGSY